jgi:thymidylate kinase
MSQRIVHIMGIDGSGKTTIGQAVAAQFAREGKRTNYLYAQHTPALLRPLKWLARAAIFRAHQPSADYAGYRNRKSSFVKRHPFLSRVYAAIWVADYVVATWWRLAAARANGGTLVVDRYYPDVAVNVSEMLEYSVARMLSLVRLMGRLLPYSQMTVWLDLPETVAFARKSDIPSLQYLIERRSRYVHVASAMSATRVIADAPLPSVVDDVYRKVSAIL